MFISHLNKALNTRKYHLSKLLSAKKKKAAALPSGRLIATTRGSGRKGYLYYEVDSSGRKRYIKKKALSLACQLAQRDYDLKVIRNTEKEIKIIDSYLKFTSEGTLEDIYPSLPAARKAVVTPAIWPDSEFIKQWKDSPYVKKGFSDNDAEHYSQSGLRVRSKSEETIANALDQLNIPFKYECPLVLSGYGTIYPDFTVLHTGRRRNILWEHLGMMDKPEYASAAVKKISGYIADGYFPGDNLILTFETSDTPLTARQVMQICRHYFSE